MTHNPFFVVMVWNPLLSTPHPRLIYLVAFFVLPRGVITFRGHEIWKYQRFPTSVVYAFALNVSMHRLLTRCLTMSHISYF